MVTTLPERQSAPRKAKAVSAPFPASHRTPKLPGHWQVFEFHQFSGNSKKAKKIYKSWNLRRGPRTKEISFFVKELSVCHAVFNKAAIPQQQTTNPIQMKTNHPSHATRSGLTLAVLASTAVLSLPLSAQAGSPQNIQATITLDREHTSIMDRLPTGEGVNEFRGDDPNAAAVAYTAGGKIRAALGYNRTILLDGNDSNKVNAGRTAYLDFAGAFECPNSIGVDLDNNGVCDPCVNTTPLLPDSRFGALDTDDVSGFPDNFNLVIAGEDYDDLQIGCTVDTWARSEFEVGTSGSEGWVLYWGPFFTAGLVDTHNPESDPIKVTRVSLTEWRFQTTGEHRAALYYRYPNYTSEYHGQFTVKFSGKVVALPGQTIPGGNHCNIQVYVGDAGCTP